MKYELGKPIWTYGESERLRNRIYTTIALDVISKPSGKQINNKLDPKLLNWMISMVHPAIEAELRISLMQDRVLDEM